MLKQRVITAIVLLAILLPTMAAQALWPFALLTLLFVCAAGWEWARLNQAPGAKAWLLGATVAVVSVFVAQMWHIPLGFEGLRTATDGAIAQTPHVHALGAAPVGFVVPAWVWWLGAVVWVGGGATALRFGVQHWRRSVPAALRLLVGVVVLVLAWLALSEAKLQGLNFLLSILCLVWVADIGAYFGGRALGKRKLAPSISPGKSWEGVAAGMVASLALAAAWIAVDQHASVDSASLYSRLLMGTGVLGLVVSVLILAAMSVVGDLFESLIKRQAGEKDSSQLLPGHGGVLDRIDALLPVLPLSLALVSLCHG